MMSRFFTRTALIAVLAGSSASLQAQSLGEVARQEAERRKALKNEGQTYTNKDLRQVFLPSSPTPEPSPTAASPSKSASATANANAKDATPAEAKAGSKPKPGDGKELVKDDAYWSTRKQALTEQLDRNQTYAAAMQSRINALTTDFVSRDDPAQRATIANDRQRATSELDRLRQAIADDKKALTDLEEEARRAGVPAGWLR
jgi:uncharacterized membrane protein YccC